MTVTTVPGRRGTRRAVVGLAAAMAVLAAGVGWFASRDSTRDGADGPRLTTPAKLPFGISLPSTRAGQPFAFGSMPVCLSSPGSVTIDRVTATDAIGGLTVDAFAVRPLSANMFGAEQVTLATSGFGGTHEVTGSCSGTPGGAELAVQLTKTSSGHARESGLAVSWHSGSRSGTTNIPAHIVLCQSANLDTPACKPL